MQIILNITTWGNKMKNKKNQGLRTVPKSNRKIVEIEAILIPLTDIYMTSHSPGFVRELQ